MQQSIPEPIFLSAPKAANLCGVSRNTICCWIRDERLPSYRTAGGKYLIRPTDLITFMKGNDMFVPPSLEEIAAEDEANQKQGTDNRETSQEPSILIVDDDPEMRRLTTRVLKPLSLPLLEAENGYEALSQLTKHTNIALVILDLIMPGQPGDEAFKEIRKHFPVLPVIVCTGQSMEEAEAVFQDPKPDLIITKPYQPNHLLGACSAYLEDLGI